MVFYRKQPSNPRGFALCISLRDTAQLQGVLNDLEKTTAFVSPVNDSLGMSPLDRTLLNDKGVRMFFEEMNRLEDEEQAAEGRSTSATCPVRPIGEVWREHRL